VKYAKRKFVQFVSIFMDNFSGLQV